MKSLDEWEIRYGREQKARYEYLKEFLLPRIGSETLLDVGAAPFHFTKILKDSGTKIKALDVNPSRFEQYISENSLEVDSCDIESQRFPYPNDYFDNILLSEVIEHLYVNPFFALRETLRVLRPGGKLYLFTDNLYSLKTIKSFMLGKSINNALNIWQKLDDLGHRGHIRLYSARELIEILQFIGFSIDEASYHNYDGRHARWFYKVAPLRFAPYQAVVAVK